MTTHDIEAPSGRARLAHAGDHRATAIARLVIGFVQGLCLWALFRAWGEGGDDAIKVWPATEPQLFGPLVLVCAFLPIVLLAGVGKLRLRTLAIWGGVAGIALALLAWHDIARQSAATDEPFLSISLLAFGAAALFIAHHLIVPADRARRWIAPFPAYFDAAWMAGVQLALSLGFTGAFWLLLLLGAALFNIIGLEFLGDLIQKPWFVFPVTGLAFATAVQLTDVRDALIRGVRAVALMLLSWLLLVMTVLVAGFLVALPFTGLDGLWGTGSATALVLAAAGALIILINTAYQDGHPDNLPPAVLRVAVRVASVLLTPLIIIAFSGLALRIGQHGLTPDRIVATACAVVGLAYAIGYGLGALVPLVRRGSPWMKALEMTNITVAVLEVAVILALFSPLADPARLAVADQVARLERGAVTPGAFDYAFLQNSSGKVGQAALARLSASDNAGIADRAKAAQAGAISSDPTAGEDFRPIIGAVPGAPSLPEGFFQPVSAEDVRRQCRAQGDCLATVGEAIGFGPNTVLLVQSHEVTFFSKDAEFAAYWPQGSYVPVRCGDEPAVDARELLRQGKLKAGLEGQPSLDTGGERQSPLSPAAPAFCNPAR